MTLGVSVIPPEGMCGIRRESYRCALSINRVVFSRKGKPQIRLCHLHALEYLTGKPVMVPSIAQQEIDMVDLGA